MSEHWEDHIVSQIGEGQPSQVSLHGTRAFSGKSADDRKVEGRLERKGKAGEIMLSR